jgi:hypothetical protein
MQVPHSLPALVELQMCIPHLLQRSRLEIQTWAPGHNSFPTFAAFSLRSYALANIWCLLKERFPGKKVLIYVLPHLSWSYGHYMITDVSSLSGIWALSGFTQTPVHLSSLLLFPKTPEIIKWSVTGYLFLSPCIRRHVASCSHLHGLRWSSFCQFCPERFPCPFRSFKTPFESSIQNSTLEWRFESSIPQKWKSVHRSDFWIIHDSI